MSRWLRSPIAPFLIAAICGVVWSIFSFYAPHTDSYTPWRDEAGYHWPTIVRFAQDFPRCDLSSYYAASTPGYHLILAGILKAGASLDVLRIVNAWMSAVCLLAAMWACRNGRGTGWLWALPVLASLNFHYSALYLRPDNASWVFVFLIIGLARSDRFNIKQFAIGGALLLLLVIFRHVHLWAAAGLWAAAYFGDNGCLKTNAARLQRLITQILFTLPAFLVVAWFMHLWHGLVPPPFQTEVSGVLPPGHSTWQHEGPNWSVPMFIMALIGLVGAWYLPLIHGKSSQRSRYTGAIIGLVIMIPVALLVPSNWDESHGRYSGMWNWARRLPMPMGRSVLLVPLALIGGAIFGYLCSMFSTRARWIAIATLLAFIVAQTANAMAWQKYYEPFVIVWIGMLAAQIQMDSKQRMLTAELASGPLSRETTPPLSQPDSTS